MATSGNIVGVDAGQAPGDFDVLPLSGEFARCVSRLVGYAALAGTCCLIVMALI